MLTEKELQVYVDGLSLDELAGQVINLEINENRHKREWIEEAIRTSKAGSVYYGNCSDEFCEWIRELQKKYCRVPSMYVADVEHGPQGAVPNAPTLPRPMAWGAADKPELVEEAHYETAKLCRKNHRHLALAPAVDINYNFRNSVMGVRSVGDDPDLVIRNTVAAVRGFQQDRLTAACCKHFPGDGMDERNQHFLNSINSLSQEEWMETYGRVWKAVIDAGTLSIMVAHIALPAFDEKVDEYIGYPPATLSYNLMTKLLKEKLGFNGCIVSDAMSMIGACAMVKADRLAVEFIKAGGDHVLFGLPADVAYIKEAVESGYLSVERLKDAATRTLRMKNALGLLDGDDEAIMAGLDGDLLTRINELKQEIADGSITVIRNADDLFPQKNLKPGAKILQAVMNMGPQNDPNPAMVTVEKELKARGYEVTSIVNPMHHDMKKLVPEHDLILLNYAQCAIGGTNRLGWVQEHVLWRGYTLQHDNVIFTSFDDPYRLYDIPFARNYVNVYSATEESQIAFVKALLGEIPAAGKSPVRFEGFFERGQGAE